MTTDTPSKCRLCGKLTKPYYDFCEECVQAEAKRQLAQLAGSQVDPTPEMQAAADACLADTPSSRDEEIPTPSEAREILGRFNASHFNNDTEHVRYSIPADPRRDDDLRLAAFIDHAEKAQSDLICLSAEREKEREIYRLALGYQSKGDFEWADKILATLNK